MLFTNIVHDLIVAVTIVMILINLLEQEIILHIDIDSVGIRGIEALGSDRSRVILGILKGT